MTVPVKLQKRVARQLEDSTYLLNSLLAGNSVWRPQISGLPYADGYNDRTLLRRPSIGAGTIRMDLCSRFLATPLS